jgi:hypothetical protein
MLDWLIALIVVAVVALISLTLNAVIETATEYFIGSRNVVIVDPATSAELERVAAQRGTQRYKRFVYDRSTKQAIMVQSNQLGDDLKNADVIDVNLA